MKINIYKKSKPTYTLLHLHTFKFVYRLASPYLFSHLLVNHHVLVKLMLFVYLVYNDPLSCYFWNPVNIHLESLEIVNKCPNKQYGADGDGVLNFISVVN